MHLRKAIVAMFAAAALGLGPAQADQPPACGAAVEVPEEHAQRLKTFAEKLELRQVRAAAGTMWHVHSTGHLPDCYVTKRAAEERGWRPGGDLWRAAPGTAIGGDHFGNREGRLPARNRYVEADLDYTGGRRGAARLVFSRESKGRWLMWVTTDHYRTFHEVPAPR